MDGRMDMRVRDREDLGCGLLILAFLAIPVGYGLLGLACYLYAVIFGHFPWWATEMFPG
jgi:hypothetical protein